MKIEKEIIERHIESKQKLFATEEFKEHTFAGVTVELGYTYCEERGDRIITSISSVDYKKLKAFNERFNSIFKEKICIKETMSILSKISMDISMCSSMCSNGIYTPMELKAKLGLLIEYQDIEIKKLSVLLGKTREQTEATISAEYRNK